MMQFDTLLRRGLMDANLAQYETVLAQADAAEPDFTPQYRRERMRLLADPWNWARPRRRLDWRVIAVIAAILILSACGYAIFTGQFTNWFPRLGVNAEHPESSEEVMARMGTVIEESQTVDGATVTLHGAVWDGHTLSLSLSIQGAGLPEDLNPKTWIYGEECTIQLPDEQKEAYIREEEIAHGHANTPAELEARVQNSLEVGNPWFHPIFRFARWEDAEDTALLQITFLLTDYLEHPELHLHLENLATYETGKGHFVTRSSDGQRSGPGPDIPLLKGPYDFTITLEQCTPPLGYLGEIDIVAGEEPQIPIRITGIGISPLRMWVHYEIPVPVNYYGDDPEEGKLDAEELDSVMGIQGFWSKDGSYLEYSERSSFDVARTPDGRANGMIVGKHPHAIDPTAVTAVNVCGVRVELSSFEPVQEMTE